MSPLTFLLLVICVFSLFPSLVWLEAYQRTIDLFKEHFLVSFIVSTFNNY